MKQQRRFLSVCVGLGLLVASASFVRAHPGSGIAVDEKGVVYFVDTGKGLWKLERGGKPELISTVPYHFMGLDATGAFSKSLPKFGQWFERLTPEGSRPTIIECPEFPIAIGGDGNLYYANTLRFPAKLMKRTPEGKESLVAVLAEESPTAAEGGPERYVTGMTVASDGSVYLVEAAAQTEHVSIRRVTTDGKMSYFARSFVPADLPFDQRPAIAPSAIPKGAPVPKMARTYCRGLTVAPDGTIYVAATASRSILAIDREKKVRVVLTADDPWAPTDVAVFGGEVYALEFDQRGDDRLFWVPRVRKVDAKGSIETLASITRD